jgi:LPS-assembly protein
LAVLLISPLVSSLGTASAVHAQNIGSSLFMGVSPQSKPGDDERVVVEARELVYNRDKGVVTAYDNVELSYKGQTVVADRITYDSNTKDVIAAGRVRIVDKEGTSITADSVELKGSLRDGFMHALRLEKDTDEGYHARFSSPVGERIDGKTTILDYATYTACNTCREKPQRPPLWRIKAARIIHDGKERTLYYEDARMEVWGIPIFYAPYFWTPDPTVKRKTGLLTPGYSKSSTLGMGFTFPFFWEAGPNYDLTFSPTYYERQGLMGQVEWRHRLESGSYRIRVTGIHQNAPEAFATGRYGAGDKTNRGLIESAGEFLITPRWRWGWNVSLMSDKWFFNNYNLHGFGYSSLFYQEAISTVYLEGAGERSYFDLSANHFKGLTTYDRQSQQPVVHPVLDYNKRVNGPESIGGEVDFTVNLTSISRSVADYRQIPQQQERLFGIYETCAIFDKSHCLLRGMSGTSTRVSAAASWQRDFIDPVGQVWKPFVFGRADAFVVSQNFGARGNDYQRLIANEADDTALRFTGGIGMEYRFPLVASFGAHATQILEPIAQIIARPDESRIGSLPNEDAQSLIFDDTNLFDWSKFSGYDRAEGGVRANLGLQYTVQGESGARLNLLAGQSFHLAGRNSYAVKDYVNTGANSGLEYDNSDYVGRLQLTTGDDFSMFVRGRFNKDDFTPSRLDGGLQFKVPAMPIRGTVFYTNYAEQPDVGYAYRREGLYASARWNLTKNWWISGSALFDLNLQEKTIITNGPATSARYWDASGLSPRSMSFGLGYDNECVTFNLGYTIVPKEYATANGKSERDEIISFTLLFKSLGPIAVSQNLSSD